MHLRRLLPPALFAVLTAALLAAAPANATDWTKLRTLNITHQGGEDEAPSATMYAFDRSMKFGSDMLEVDVNVTKDGKLAIIHDGTVDRTTNGTGEVIDYTMDQLKKLDAAHWFVPIAGVPHDRADSEYVFRGVRTGDKQPPMGFKKRDFRPLELDELMQKYPDVPINIEIKGGEPETPADYVKVAEALAKYLNKLGRTDGIMVASFNDVALGRFHELAPDINLAAATGAVAGYVIGNVQPPEGVNAFQVPTSFNGITLVDEAFIDRAHRDDYGVHVWTINDEPTMNQLLDWDVDGIMSAEPSRLEKVLCARGTKRPPLPASVPGHHCANNVSIACDVEATSLKRQGRKKVKVTIVRHDNYESRCAGRVALKAIGAKARKAGKFNFTWQPPEDGGPSEVVAKVRLSKKLRKAIRKHHAAKVTVFPYGGFKKKTGMSV